MIAIIYPKYDELAREIAVKTELDYDNVYIVNNLKTQIYFYFITFTFN